MIELKSELDSNELEKRLKNHNLEDSLERLLAEMTLKESSKLDDIDAKADDKKEKAKKMLKKEIDDADADRDEEKKELKESFAVDVIADLVDRAKLIFKEGKHEQEEAVHEAIDEGLIYNEDILALAEEYGVIDYSELLNDMYENLFEDIYNRLSDELEDEAEEDEDEVSSWVESKNKK